ncbi:unnamed protein product, partial [Nippostrongylus brasiliensis]|uniref:EB1 C-terminal domain-containing protein n=1 Tax=Nippostrongylus brasiliensis TaxID=27835 RepID=A0A0N4XMM6_NIPBR
MIPSDSSNKARRYNKCLKANFSNIEEMSTGACQLSHLLFRDSLDLRKVKWNSWNEMDHKKNWKILGTKPLLVERSTKAKFQDNFEFLQWFFKFFNANFIEDGEEYDAVGARGGEPLQLVLKDPHNPDLHLTQQLLVERLVYALIRKLLSFLLSAYTRIRRSSSAMKALEEENARLSKQYNEAIEIAQTMEKERDFYSERLRKIEYKCN